VGCHGARDLATVVQGLAELRQPYSSTTLYVVATPEGETSGGVTGAEFRVEVSNPAGWMLAYFPPNGAVAVGNPLDTQPSNPSDGSGIALQGGADKEAPTAASHTPVMTPRRHQRRAPKRPTSGGALVPRQIRLQVRVNPEVLLQLAPILAAGNRTFPQAFPHCSGNPRKPAETVPKVYSSSGDLVGCPAVVSIDLT